MKQQKEVAFDKLDYNISCNSSVYVRRCAYYPVTYLTRLAKDHLHTLNDSPIRKAKAEGYQAFLISNEMSTLSALQQIHRILLAKNLDQNSTTLSEDQICDSCDASVSAVVAEEDRSPSDAVNVADAAGGNTSVLENTPRKKKTSHRNQVIAGITPTVVSAAVSTCLFALIPHLGKIAILPAVLVLVVGIAISIAAPLIIHANA